MRKHLTIAIIALLANAAYAVSTNEILGAWSPAITTDSKITPVGVVRWTSIQFATNRVSWSWERDGKTEDHTGRFGIHADPVAEPGAHQRYTLTIIPTSFATTHAIVLRDLTHDLDNRLL